jgi:hypothetical protein
MGLIISGTYENSFTVSSPVRLSVNTIRGSVEIHPGEEGIIQVTTTKQIHTGEENRTQVEITQEADGSVKATTRFPDSTWNCLSGSHPCEVDYVVKAPHHCLFKLKNVSDQVSAEGFEGDFNINSVNGGLKLSYLTGSLIIHTVSGETKGECISGLVNLDTVSGNLELMESTFRSINTKSVSGT